MPAARCSMCAANYPPELEGRSCPACSERLYLQPDEDPDPDLMHYTQQRSPAALPAGERPGSAAAPARVVERDGLLWIAEAALQELGYYDLSTFDHVDIDGQSFEVQGFKASAAEWWVERTEG